MGWGMTKGGMAALAMLAALLWWVAPAGALDAQHIAEIKQGSNESLLEFLRRFPASFEAQLWYGLFGSGIVGALLSYAWKWYQGVANGSHWTPRYVVGQMLWLGGSAVLAIVTVGFTTPDGQFFGWLSVLWAGGFAGFSGEVKFKEKARQAWSPEERAARAQDADASKPSGG